MLNVPGRRAFSVSWAPSLALCWCFACSGSSDPGATGPAPVNGRAAALPASPALQPDGSDAVSAPEEPGSATQPEATPPSGEGPALGSDTPVLPALQMGAPAAPASSPPAPAAAPPGAEATPPPSDMQPVPTAGPDPNFLIFLLIGQSNMEGAPASEPQDRGTNPRVKVLALRDCPQRNQVHDQWYVAAPSLHTCGNTLGPGDYFAKTLADALPNASIGLVPDAIAGVDIDIFRKGIVSARRNEFSLPPDNQRNSAYETVIERARLAQQVGVIRGILFHQGESDAATGALQQAWPGKVQELVQDIRTDLGLDSADVPFLAGELLANGPPQNGCCGSAMNPKINSLPGLIPNALVVPGAGLGVRTDGLHYDVVGQREFGRRYGQIMLGALGL
jgi:hypothetical protein